MPKHIEIKVINANDKDAPKIVMLLLYWREKIAVMMNVLSPISVVIIIKNEVKKEDRIRFNEPCCTNKTI